MNRNFTNQKHVDRRKKYARENYGVHEEGQEQRLANGKVDVCYRTMDLFKIIVGKSVENNEMRRALHALWLENEDLKRFHDTTSKKVPLDEVKDGGALQELEKEMLKVKSEFEDASKEAIELRKAISERDNRIKDLEKPR